MVGKVRSNRIHNPFELGESREVGDLNPPSVSSISGDFVSYSKHQNEASKEIVHNKLTNSNQ